MDDFTIIIGVIGSFASIYGAYISVEAMRKSKKSANIAEVAKNQVLKKQKTTNLVNLLYEAKSIQDIFGKYAVFCTRKLTPYGTRKLTPPAVG